ncbi:MAG: lactate racemase domain-containing protein [Planctomycetaceae bacterium]
MPVETFSLPYGRRRTFECQLDADLIVGCVRPPQGLTDVAQATRQAVLSPIDFPPVRQLLVGGDRVVIVLDRQTPQADQLLAGLWSVLADCGVEAEHVLVIQPAHLRGGQPVDPRLALPAGVREQVSWQVHDPLDAGRCGYLATSTGGERLYLTRDLLDADVVICVGPIEFDESLGYRGTLSSVYPGLSTADTLRKVAGAAHVELEPDSPRPLRELADEVGWLLGVQFVLQVIPAADGGVADVLAGLSEAVLARGKERLRQLWQIDIAERAEFVIASVDEDAGGHSWPQVAAALDTARRIVSRDGRILLLTELATAPTKGIEIIRDAHTPHEALRPLREQADVDRVEALQLAQTLDRANVYLLSHLEDDLVEDLFMVPIASPEEALRVIDGADRCAVIGSAQHVFVRHLGADS